MTVPGIAVAAKSGTPYDTIVPFVGPLPASYIGSKVDQLRVASYDLYDAIYRNVTGTFKLIARGTENNPIYIPSGKTIVETCNRYLGVGFDFNLSGGAASDRAAVSQWLSTWMRKNKFYSKYTTQKRYGLIRGDAMWHIIGDDNKKDPWKRVQAYELDPRTYFAITDPDDSAKVVGCHIIKRMTDPSDIGKQIVRRLTYQFNPPSDDPEAPEDGTIQASLDYYPEAAWDDRIDQTTLKPFQINVAPLKQNNLRQPLPYSKTLPATIDNLPVYHIKNQREPLDAFGVSEMAGIERLIAAVNQAVSDEELALALDGLGLYSTTSGPPVDDRGNPVNWTLGPGRVVEIEEGSNFTRVAGVGSITPAQEHMAFLIAQMRQNSATADVAVGIVNNTTPLSGIALALMLGPLLAKCREKEAEMTDEYDTMLSDLMFRWLPTYKVVEAVPPDTIDIMPHFDDPMPVDRPSIVAEVVGLVAENIITIAEAQSICEDKLGYEFKFSKPDDFMKQMDMLRLNADPFGGRLVDEAGNPIDKGDATNDPNAIPPSKVVPAPGATPPAA